MRLLARLLRRREPAAPDGLRAEVARYLRSRWWPPAPLSADAYLDGVCALLRSGASARRVAEHLCREEEERWLGFRDTEPHELMPLGSRLVRIARKHGYEARA